MTQLADPDTTGEISFEAFIKLNARIFEDKCNDEDVMVLQAFQVSTTTAVTLSQSLS